MIRKLFNFWARVSYFIMIGACFTMGITFALAAYEAGGDDKMIVGWSISALFFALGFGVYDSYPPRLPSDL